MKQYEEMKKKQKHPDTICLIRVGNFWETFGDDAHIVSQICGLPLMFNVGEGGKMVYFVIFLHESLDKYLPMLVKSALRVGTGELLGANL